jgi:sugar phosphate isomerase/epimerase
MGVDIECMAWRVIRTLTLAGRVVEAAARPNGGVLVDALHLSRTGGIPQSVREIAPGRIQSAQLCDAHAKAPIGTESIILEARSQRLPPGTGHLPLIDLIAALPDHTVLSVEVPMASGADAEEHARQVFAASQALIKRCGAA